MATEKPDTIYVPLSREQLERALNAVAAKERLHADCCENCRLTIETEEALRTALDNPPPERTEEFRVVGEAAGKVAPLGTHFSLPAAQETVAFWTVPGRWPDAIRIQRRELFRTPWEDIDDEH